MTSEAGLQHLTLRQQLLLDGLRVAGFQTVSDLSSQLGVSDMTVRRDLRKLDESGLVRIFHGGASLSTTSIPQGDYQTRAVEHAAAKRAIARAAVGMVLPDDTIGVDGGTTAFGVAELLPPAFAGSVVTASAPVIHHLSHMEHARVVGVGGDLYRPSQTFVGPAAVSAIEGLRMRILFLGVGAADERGLYVAADVERPTKLALMAAADRVVVLADATKFTSFAPIRLCSWSDIDAIVCDAAPPAVVAAAANEAGVSLTVAAQ